MDIPQALTMQFRALRSLYCVNELSKYTWALGSEYAQSVAEYIGRVSRMLDQWLHILQLSFILADLSFLPQIISANEIRLAWILLRAFAMAATSILVFLGMFSVGIINTGI
jgi:hypothetical protein